MLITDDENIAKMAKHRAKDSNKNAKYLAIVNIPSSVIS